MIDVALAMILVAVAACVSAGLRLQIEKELVIAVLRALVQLSLLALAVQAVFDDLGLSALLLIVMLAAASWTSRRRLKGVPRAMPLAAAAISAASGTALSVLFLTDVFPAQPRYVIPIAGMLIGNSMTATSLAGSRLRDELVDKALEVEARLALGVRATDALKTYVRRAITTALLPTIDATKNVGLILLPGAFVGMLLGGASPARAAEVQLIVLFMLTGAVAVASMTAAILVGRAFVGAGDRLVIPDELVS